MRYQSGVSDFLHLPALTGLNRTEARLAAALTRPRWIAFGCIAVLAACGWIALGLCAAQSGGFAFLCGAAAGPAQFALVLAIWIAMTLAMMLPTAGPMILTYAEIADTAAGKHEAVVSPVILAAGYLAVWLGFALLAALAQVALPHDALSEQGVIIASGVLFIGAGLYQFSALKRACLTKCQHPFPFFFANWTDERSGVFRLGSRQGLYCLGCCVAMMLLMFASGVMNVVVMAALGVAMTIEKTTTTPTFSRILGAIFVVTGAVFIGAGFLR
jgi:predicted metal-binding membrane protein